MMVGGNIMMVDDDTARVDQLAGHLAILRAEVQKCAADPDNAAIRGDLLETVAIFERVINRLARPRPANGASRDSPRPPS